MRILKEGLELWDLKLVEIKGSFENYKNKNMVISAKPTKKNN